MSSALRVLILAVLPPLALCQTTQPPPAPKGSIEGAVIRADTREPLKKAWVTVHRIEGQGRSSGVLTDASGRFELTDIEPGRYRLSVQRNGYVSLAYGRPGLDQPGTVLSISPGQTIRDIQLAMTAAGVLTGHIYDDDGDPVVRARIEILSFMYREGRRELIPMSGGMTDDRGEYRVYGLSPGTYFISATFGGWGRSAASRGNLAAAGSGDEMGYSPTYYPGTNDIGRAIPVELKAGEEVPGLDFNLLSTRAVRVRGRILNPAKEAHSSRVLVMLAPRSESKGRFFPPSAQTNVNNPEGEFELRGVVPGSYTLIANAWAGEESYLARIPLEVGPTDVDGLIVPLGKGIEIVGRVRWGGNPRRTRTTRFASRSPPAIGATCFGEGLGTSSPMGVSPSSTFLTANIAPVSMGLRKIATFSPPAWAAKTCWRAESPSPREGFRGRLRLS